MKKKTNVFNRMCKNLIKNALYELLLFLYEGTKIIFLYFILNYTNRYLDGAPDFMYFNKVILPAG